MPERTDDMRTIALTVCSLAFPYAAQAASPTSEAGANKTLERAILLAGQRVANCRSRRLGSSRCGIGWVEAWMLRG